MALHPANRNSGPSAATLIALLAMTAAVSGAPVAEMDGRSERGVVRAVAAVMAAAARDLAREMTHGERSSAAMPAIEPMIVCGRRDLEVTPILARAVPEPTRLAERLLDLPPPRC